MTPLFFATPELLRTWFAANHTRAREQWIGFFKKGSGTASITWPQSVDQALCFGWIDGLRKSIDEDRYMIRFTPRKPSSIWSSINSKRVRELTALGAMTPSGSAAFEKRDPERSGVYSHEQKKQQTLSDAYQSPLKANKKAWEFFQSQPPWYQRAASHWVATAKKEETRSKRLATLIEDCAQGRTIAPLTRK